MQSMVYNGNIKQKNTKGGKKVLKDPIYFYLMTGGSVNVETI